MRAALLLALLACHRESAETKPAPAAAPEVNVPSLPDERGTLPVDPGKTITITAASVTVEGVGTFERAKLEDIRTRLPKDDGPPAALHFAVDRTLTLGDFADVYERGLGPAGSGLIDLIVVAPQQRRMVYVERPRAINSSGESSMVVLSANGLAFGDKLVTLDELRAEIAKSPPDIIRLVVEPDVTMQRIAETVAAAGGRAALAPAPVAPKPMPAPPATHVQPTTSAGVPSYDPPEAWTLCAHDEECTVTGAQCGNHSFPINKQHASDAEAAVAKLCKGHPDVVLISVMPRPRCTKGHCEDANRPRSGGLNLP